jgi:hypothetical protein
MNQAGQWVPTQPASAAFRSYHLPSLYSPSPECDFGRLAVKFLERKQSAFGVQGFVNGDLAEPDMSQGELSRVSLEVRTERIGEGTRLMTIDCQAKAPFFWWVVREWTATASHGIACGSAESIDELERIMVAHEIMNDQVIVDSGYGAYDDAEVYRHCANHSEHIQRGGRRILCVGWLPSKGLPGRRRWKDKDGVFVPFTTQEIDPYIGTDRAGYFALPLLEFSTDAVKDALHTLMNSSAFKWTVSREMHANADYQKHITAENKVLCQSRGRSFYRWEKRHRTLPNHLWDCEVMQVAGALYLQLLVIPEAP